MENILKSIIYYSDCIKGFTPVVALQVYEEIKKHQDGTITQGGKDLLLELSTNYSLIYSYTNDELVIHHFDYSDDYDDREDRRYL